MKTDFQHCSQPVDPVRQGKSRSAVPSPATDLPEPYKKALLLWLQWNDAYERVSTKMFQSGQEQRKLEDMMDQMDRLRTAAVELSRDLLD